MNRSTLLSLLGSLVLGAAALQAGTVTYQVTVDTSGFAANTPGFIDFQFNQASTNSLTGLASITSFTSTGYTFNDSLNYVTSGITGSFSSLPVVIPNDAGGTNVFARGVTSFGSNFTALVTLSGNVVGGTAGDPSQFFVILEDTNGASLFPTLGLVGEIATVTVNTDGSTTPSVNSFAGGSAYAGAPTPEPSTILLGLAGLAALAARRRHA